MRLSGHHGFLRGIGWGLALASAAWALLAFSTYSSVYAAGLNDLSRSLRHLRFDPLFLYAAVGLWLAAAVTSRTRRARRAPLASSSTRMVVTKAPLESVSCIECGSVSDSNWSGWRACRTEDTEGIEEPEISFFCPECAHREFGRQTRTG